MESHAAAVRVIDGFRLEQVLHEGGMSTIWRASRPGVNGPVAVKIPRLRYGEDPATVVGFEVERMILPALTGIHVPRFVAAGDFDRPYIAMELVAGRSLFTRLDDLPLAEGEVASIGARVARALDDIHRQDVIHHDVKPSNVIMRPEGEATLIDFGLSRHARMPDLLAEEFRVPIGSGAYISPEQLLQNRRDARSDLFSLGVILYFFATGERPFGDPMRMSDWRRRLWRDPVPPRRRRPELSPALQEIILRCLAVDPGDRHASAGELAADLEHPDAVVLTERAARTRCDGMLSVARRRLQATRAHPAATDSADRAPMVLAAIDLGAGPALDEALRRAVSRIVQAEPGARLACVNVLKLSRVLQDELEDEQGRNLHLVRLAELRRWARSLPIAPERITYHVLEAPDPAAALIEHARANRVDHIVMGARASSVLRRYLGSVSSEVVAQAGCTVTVVRAASDGAGPPSTDQPP